jgi:uncharacterized membrane-anchored protein
VIKLLTTGMGEAASDWLAGLFIPLAAVVGIGGMAVALYLQFRTRRYQAPVYWFTVMMVAVFGTMAADGIHQVGVPYIGSSIFYGAAVAVVFWLWHRSERTLSIHSIVTRRREVYYWITVFASFALGTALGDLTASEINLGFATSIALFAALICLPVIAWRLGVNEVVAFWVAYVLTRPLGASIADYLGKPHRLSGVDLGDGPVAGVALVLIAALVAWLAVTRRDRQEDRDAATVR